ncbi:hypothetical protein AB0E62_34075 [Streptomyces sp. NPDC038707]|uniref:hypothetical protein n=1 Tax=Streptomyces sp. NPDC038707 TaxID=3154329 RepID=UPI0033DECF6F
MKRLVIFGDVQAAGAEVLRTALAERSEAYTQGVTVGTRVPTIRSPEDDQLPFVLVRKDTDIPHPSMANARCTLRCTVWHQDADQAHDLAMLCQGLWLVHSGPVIRGFRPGSGPIPTTDDETGVDLSTFTAIANVKPTVVATS